MSDGMRWVAYVVPHTHWDREWYQPFQVFRARLVRVMDHVLEVLAREPEFRRFTLDGQAVILEDYLEVRPERREEIRRLIAQDRLRIGPWYVLADEFLVSPEALIRNLAQGRRTCRTLGRPMAVAYTPDSFGHIAQLPRIVKGFGLETIVFGRGMGDEGERLGAEFTWEAGDGVSVLAIHLAASYSAVAALGHRTWDQDEEEGEPFDPDLAGRHVRAILFGAPEPPEELPLWLRNPIARLQGGLAARSRSGALLLPNGSDHLFLQEDLPAVLDRLRQAIPEVEFILGDLEEYVAAVREANPRLERYRGEFRGGRYHHILSGVLSARVPIKLANHRAELLLERYTEPLAALEWLAGSAYPDGLLECAWKTLLKNHAHDSIYGCSVDAVHREVETRFASVSQIGETLAATALQKLARAGGAEGGETGLPAGELLAVFNPLPRTREAVVCHTLLVPAGQGAELGVTDPSGRSLPVQVEVEQVPAPGRSDRWVDRVELRFAATLPPLGVSTFAVVGGAGTAPGGEAGVEVGPDYLQNRFLRLEAGPEGPVLIERSSGRRHSLALRFEDVADAGDTYDFSPLAGDEPILAVRPDGPPEVVRAGPIAGAVRVSYGLVLPERLSIDRRRRIGGVEMPVRVTFGLEASSRTLRVDVELWNRAEDHRLRILFGTGIHCDHVLAGDAFQIARRPVRPPAGEGWYQRPQATAPMRHFVAAADDHRGLAVFARGLHEYEAIPTSRGIDLAVTLVRSVGWLSRDDLTSRPQGAGPSIPTPEAQCPGRHRFELAVMPFDGPYWESPLLEEVEAFIAPPLARPVPARPGQRAGFLELSPPLLLSAMKRADERESLIVRFWNPAPRPVDGWIRLARRPHALYDARLDETRLAELPVAPDPDGRLALRIGPGEVRTLELVGLEETGGGDARQE